MLHLLYSFCFRLALPFVLVRLWWQGRQAPENSRNWQQRLGFIERSEQPVIWVHAVSVGETIAAAPMVRAMLRQNPETPILMTAMTSTGAARARAMFGDQVRYAYSPYDTPGSVRRFVARARPRALVIMETELWPNLIRCSDRQDVPVFLINARLSARSAARYERVPSLVRPLLQRIHWIAAQAEEDAGRFRQIGARSGSVTVTGSIKFDVEILPEVREQARELRARMGPAGRPVWIAASTHTGEDEIVLAAHRQVLGARPDALLVMVPRHPERFDRVAGMIGESGLSLARRSRDEEPAGHQVYLGDTMGELMMLYGAADVAFVGGSLIERGGHNPLEPAAWAKPVISGPHVFNFETIYRQLEQGNGVTLVNDVESVAGYLERLFDDPGQARREGDLALAVVDANRGALDRIVSGIIQRSNSSA